jgi:hypothetical protein
MPWGPFIASTYGCVQALHGDPNAALIALERAIAAPGEKKKRAPALAGLALSHARLNNPEASAAALARAEATDPGCPMLKIVRERIARTTGAPQIT